MIRFAVGWKCGANPPLAGIATGDDAPAMARFPSSDASATAPMPMLARCKKCRRVSSKPASYSGFITLSLRDGFIEIEHQVRYHRPGGQLHRVERLVPGRLARGEQLLGRLGRLAILGE